MTAPGGKTGRRGVQGNVGMGHGPALVHMPMDRRTLRPASGVDGSRTGTGLVSKDPRRASRTPARGPSGAAADVVVPPPVGPAARHTRRGPGPGQWGGFPPPGPRSPLGIPPHGRGGGIGVVSG